MLLAFIKGATAEFPQASLTFDRFHVMQIVNNAVDTVCREERRSRPELEGTRHVWMKNSENLC